MAIMHQTSEYSEPSLWSVKINMIVCHYAEILSEFHQKRVLVLHKNLKIVCKYRTLFWRFIQGRLETI